MALDKRILGGIRFAFEGEGHPEALDASFVGTSSSEYVPKGSEFVDQADTRRFECFELLSWPR